MGLVVVAGQGRWSPDGAVNDDLRQRAVVARDEGHFVELTGDCRITTLEQLEDGAGTWRLELHAGTEATLYHDGFAVDAFLAEGELSHGASSWPRLGFRRFAPRTVVTMASRAGATLWLKARSLPVWQRRSLSVDRPDFDVGHPSGIDLCELSPAAQARVVLLRFAPGCVLGWHEHERGEELVVVEGCLHDDRGVYRVGSWVRQPAGSGHEVKSPEGCILYTHSGHLPRGI